MANEQPAGLPSPFDVLKEAWQIYKNRLGTFLGIMLVPAIFLAIMIFLISIFYIFTSNRAETNWLALAIK